MLSDQLKNTANSEQTRDSGILLSHNQDNIINILSQKKSYVKQSSSPPVNELTVKIHTDLLPNLIQSRELNNTYETNKLLKDAAAYYILKTVTTTGVIQDYPKQLPELCAYLNCTTPTFYNTIKRCEKRGFLKRTRHTIVLKSFTEFTNAAADSVFTQFTKIRYNYKDQKLHHIMQAAYLELKERERARTFESKLKALPELNKELETLIKPDSDGNYQSALKALQIQAFKYGHEKMYSIFFLNPFTSCNQRTLRKMFAFKSHQSVAYLKSNLHDKKLVNVAPVRIPSQKTQRVKHLFIKWDDKTKQTIWLQPDRMEFAPNLIL